MGSQPSERGRGTGGKGLVSDRVALAMLAGSLVIRLVAAASVGPGFDEAYYHAFSLHLSWGYFDHPPAVAVAAGLGRWITGLQHPLTLRLGAVLLFTAALAGLYSLTRRFFGRRAALFAIALPHATPYFLVGAGAFVIPDNALCAAWVWALVLLARLRDRNMRRTLGFCLLGLACGVALQAKYHGVLLPVCLAIAGIRDREIRNWWRDPRLYLAGAVALAVFSPCIAWNAQNGWISFVEQFGKAGSGATRVRLDLLGQAVGGQLGYLTPWMAIAFWIGALRRRPGDSAARWLLPFFLVPVIGFTALGFRRLVMPHWTMPGYLAAIVLAAGDMARRPARIPGRREKWVSWAVGANVCLISLVLLHMRLGLLALPPKADPTLEPIGWRVTLEYLELQDELGEDDVLFVHKWFTGGETVWADRNRHPVVHLGGKPHMFAWWAPASEYQGRSGVFITQERYGLNEAACRELLHDRFERVRSITVPPVQRGKQTMHMQVWRVENLVRPPPPPYGRGESNSQNPTRNSQRPTDLGVGYSLSDIECSVLLLRGASDSESPGLPEAMHP